MITDEAIEVARQAHGDDTDLSGNLYIEHPLRVTDAVAQYGHDFAVVAALHDVIEDTGFVLSHWSGYTVILDEDNHIQGTLNEAQGLALEAITRRPHPMETYIEYIWRVSQNPIATVVKVADLKDNLAPRRNEQLSEEKRTRLAKRYYQALRMLSTERTA